MKREVRGILWAFFSLFLGLSLFSYQGVDPGFFSDTTAGVAKNLCGVAGAYLSDFLIAVLGVIVFLMPFLILKLVVDSFRGEAGKVRIQVLRAGLFLWVLSGILSVDLKNFRVFGETLSAGGIAGNMMASMLVGFLNRAGAYLVMGGFLALIIFSLRKKFIFPYVFAWLDMRSSGESVGKSDLLRIKARKEQAWASDVAPAISVREAPDRRKQNSCRKSHFRLGIRNASYNLPDMNILNDSSISESRIDRGELIRSARKLEEILLAYKIEGRVIEVLPGPVITMYEFEPASGVKVNQIVTLADDIAMKLKAESVRIVTTLPGKGAVGIEVPNREREMVFFKDVCLHDNSFAEKKLPLVLGKNIQGEGVTTDLTQMPHLLIAGTTGSGKSVSVNVMISSLLFTRRPEEVRMIMIDPKAIEFSCYEDVPHLLMPVINDPSRANYALKWAVSEMERRYQLMLELNVRKIEIFNEKIRQKSASELTALNEKWFLKSNPDREDHESPKVFKVLPYIVIVIDELADLMLIAAKEVEISIARLAQKARASGIHLIVATQRPSTDVITGLIKANFSSRIAFRVASKVDSRIILDTGGADKLLGHGDMLFIPPGTSRIARIHGAYLTDSEVETVASHWKNQGEPEYLGEEEIMKSGAGSLVGDDEHVDELFDRAIEIVAVSGQASISMLQRKLSIGYNRSARIIEMMEEKNMVGPSDGSRPREVYINPI